MEEISRLRAATVRLGSALLIYIFASNISYYLIQYVLHLLPESGAADLREGLFGCVQYMLSMLPPLYYLCRRNSLRCELRLPQGPVWRCSVSLFFTVLVGVTYVNRFMTYVFERVGFGWPALDLSQSGDSVVVLVLALLRYALLPAVLEELFFRAAVIDTLAPYGLRAAIPVSAALFMMFHTDLSAWPGIFILGAFFAWLYVKTGSVIPGMLCHFINNGTAVLVVWLELRGAAQLLSAVYFVIYTMCFFGAGLFAAEFIVRRRGGGLSVPAGGVRAMPALVFSSPAVLLALCYCLFNIIVQAVRL